MVYNNTGFFRDMQHFKEASDGAQGATGPFLAIDLVVSSSSHKAVSILNVNIPRPRAANYVLHYVCYFWAKKFKVQTSDELCISGSSKGMPHSPILSDVTKQTTVTSELAESLTAFKQHG